MKLKKIVSLALAGVLAVSMLTACDGKGSSSSEGETEVTPVTGVAATVNANLDSNKEKISFEDDEILTRLVENYFEDNDVKVGVWSNSNLAVVSNTTAFADLLTDVQDYLGVTQKTIGFDNLFGNNNDNYTNNTGYDGTYAEIYVLNSTIYTEEDALKQVAKHIDGFDMPAEGDNDADSVDDVDYTYTGSIAAIEAESKGGTESVWVVAVTITRNSATK